MSVFWWFGSEFCCFCEGVDLIVGCCCVCEVEFVNLFVCCDVVVVRLIGLEVVGLEVV